MTEPEALYHNIAETTPDAVKGKMFGALCIKAPNGKAAAMFYKGEMVFKLTGDAAQEALSLDGAHIFSPMGDRTMNGWIQVPYDYAGKWPEYAVLSMEYVKTLR